MPELNQVIGNRELVMVSNRLPVDRVVNDDGSMSWRTSPGGLVTAVEPIVDELGCVWIGWAGTTDEAIEPFEVGAMRLRAVTLTTDDVELYYEGFSNGTLWPLYHDVIVRPEFHREWWRRYERVNRRFAEATAEVAAEGAIVWVHDYQLQLVPEMLRQLRPDLTLAFFLHIPFPPARLFEQLPWRKRIVEGLLGADVIGFQQASDATAFREAAERLTRSPALGNTIVVPGEGADPSRTVLAQEFPISIDADEFAQIAARPEVQRRAREIRSELGDPDTLMLGVDRLDYTKGIGHRLQAYEELLEEGEFSAERTVMIQVASPSREGVDAYRTLRDEVETTAGRINGAHGSIGSTPLIYLHQGHSRTEMVAMYLAADVLLVTPLRDGMNLVAKEYVACRRDEQGVLVLSEFAGAAEELSDAVLVNPHDISGLKAAMLRAAHMPTSEQSRRMRALRKKLWENDVAHWATAYLDAVASAAKSQSRAKPGPESGVLQAVTTFLPRRVEERVRRLAALPKLIIASDFDGTLAPIVRSPTEARMLSRTRLALEALRDAPETQLVLLTGRSLADLEALGVDTGGWIVAGSHGAELVDNRMLPGGISLEDRLQLDDGERGRLERLKHRVELVFHNESGVRIESKPFGLAVHARQVDEQDRAREVLDAASALGDDIGLYEREGKLVREFSVRETTKADALARVRHALPAAPVLFLGDDLTDEDVFRALTPDDVGVKVGEGNTAAHERVEDPTAVSTLLALLAELRAGTVIGTPVRRSV